MSEMPAREHDWNAWTGKCNRCGHLLPYPSEIGPDWRPDRPCDP